MLVHQDQTAAFAAIAGQRRASIVLGLVAVVIGSVLAAYSAKRITGPINRLTETAVHISDGNLNSRAPVETQDEIGTLAVAFNSMTAQLRDFIGSLEEHVANRTQALSTSAEVSRHLSTIVEVDHLVSEVVNQMCDAFGYYYAQIYLFDASQKKLVLAGGTGEAGQTMLASGHALQLGQGLVGRAAANNEIILIDDVAREEAWLPNELLPDTRSEIAVPIATGGKVVGVLDVQHNVVAGFNEESAELLQSIANQVAIAIQNARTFEQLQQQEESLINSLEQSSEQARRLELLSELGALFNAAKDLDGVYEIAGPRILDIVYGERAIVSLMDPSGETFQATVLTDETGVLATGVKMPLAGTVVGMAIRENRLLNLPRDISFDEFSDARRLYASGIQSAIVVPLVASNEVIGTLNVASQQPEAFQDIDVNFAQQIATLLASTIESHMLAEQARLLASVVEDHPDFVATGSLDGNIRYINPAGLQMLGLPKDHDVARMDIADFYSPEDAERLIQEGIPAALVSGSWTFEAALLTADGRQLAVEETIGINHDAEGNPLSFNMTLHDITERKEAEKAIRESEARLHTLIEYAPEVVVVIDADTRLFTKVNENAVQLFGLSREELLTTGPLALSPEFQPDGRSSVEAAVENIKATLSGETPVFEWTYQNAAGQDVFCETRLVKLPGSGNLIRGSFTDITERLKVQAAITKLASDLQIVAEVSRIATTILDTEQLLQQVVDLTKERFGLYHVHIYLMGEDKQRLNLAAGAGELGQMMVADGYQIPLIEKESLVARAARTRQGVIVNDVREEAGFLSNPLLPGTRSELAAPLIVGDEVLGVLDVQSDEVDYFSETDINIQTTLALQIAAALQNAAQYQKAQEALAELTKLQQIMVHEGWESYLQEDHLSGYVYDLHQLQPLEPENDTVDPVAGLNLNDTAVRSPLTVRGATIGTLGIYDPSGQPVSPEKRYLLESISQQVAEALERARLFEETEMARTQVEQALAETQRRTEELAIINEIVTKLGSSLDMQTSMQSVADGLAEALGVEQVRVTLVDESKKNLTIMAEHHNSDKTESALGMKIPLAGNELTQEVMRRRKAVKITDVENDARVGPVRDMLLAQGIEQIFVLPMLSGNEVIGTVGVDILDKNQMLTADQMQLAEKIVSQAATAVQSSRLFTQVEERAAELATINAISEVASSQLELDALIEVVGLRLYETFNSKNLYIALYDEKTDTIDFPFFYIKEEGLSELPSVSLHEGGGLAAQIIQSGEPVLLKTITVENAQAKGAVIIDPHLTSNSYIGVPMMVGNKVIGVIGVNDRTENQIFTESDRDLLLTLAGTVGVAIQNARLFVETEERAEELAVINQVAEVVAQQLETDQLFTAVHEQIKRTLAVDTFFASVYNSSKDWFEFVYFFDHGRQTQVDPLPADPSYETVQVYQSGKPITINYTKEEYEVQKGMADKLLDAGKMPSNMIFVPLRAGAEIIGVVSIQNYQFYWYTEADVALFGGIANHVAVALENIRLFTETQKRAERERLVNEINQKIQSTTSVESALQIAVQELGKAFGAKHTAVQLSLAPKKEPKNGSNGSAEAKRSVSNGS